MVQDLGVLKLKSGPSLKLKSGPSFFTVFPIFIVFWGIFRNTNSATVCQHSVFAKLGDVKNEVFEQKIAFFVFSFFMLENRNRKKKKRKWKGPKTL